MFVANSESSKFRAKTNKPLVIVGTIGAIVIGGVLVKRIIDKKKSQSNETRNMEESSNASKQKEALIQQFQSKTGKNKETAENILRQNNWELDVSIFRTVCFSFFFLFEIVDRDCVSTSN